MVVPCYADGTHNNVNDRLAYLKLYIHDYLPARTLRSLIGAVVCLHAAPRVHYCSLARAMDGRIMRYGIISSCQSAATSEIVKR